MGEEQPTICQHDVSSEWATDFLIGGEAHPCPWCRIAELEAELAVSRQQTADREAEADAKQAHIAVLEDVVKQKTVPHFLPADKRIAELEAELDACKADFARTADSVRELNAVYVDSEWREAIAEWARPWVEEIERRVKEKRDVGEG